ncbi:MAG: DUF3551 domain-containing protein, partial [Xanthobacteraceae bacterium]
AAALMTSASAVAHAQATTKGGVSTGTNAQYCLDLRGAKTCKYDTIAACQKDAAGNGTCVTNPNFAAKKGEDAMKSRAMEPKGASDNMKKSSPIKQESDSVKKQ